MTSPTEPVELIQGDPSVQWPDWTAASHRFCCAPGGRHMRIGAWHDQSGNGVVFVCDNKEHYSSNVAFEEGACAGGDCTLPRVERIVTTNCQHQFAQHGDDEYLYWPDWSAEPQSKAQVLAELAAQQTRKQALAQRTEHWHPASSHPSINQLRAQQQRSGRRCFCGHAARCETVKKYGPTQGQQFWVCAVPPTQPGRCSFFQWCDETAAKRLLYRPLAQRRRPRRLWSRTSPLW